MLKNDSHNEDPYFIMNEHYLNHYWDQKHAYQWVPHVHYGVWASKSWVRETHAEFFYEL